jgi:hypothetical protein
MGTLKPSFTISGDVGVTPIVVTTSSSSRGGLYITQGTSWLHVPADMVDEFIDAADQLLAED